MKSSASDFERRKRLAWSVFRSLDKIWKASHLPLHLKVIILKTSVLSVFLYGCESWIIDRTLGSRINALAMAFYRTILGISRLQRIPNETILGWVGQEPLVDTVCRRQLGWLGHVLRRNDDEPAKIFALYQPEHGKSKCDRQSTSYFQHRSSLLSETPEHMTPTCIAELAKNERKKRVVNCRPGEYVM